MMEVMRSVAEHQGGEVHMSYVAYLPTFFFSATCRLHQRLSPSSQLRTRRLPGFHAKPETAVIIRPDNAG